MMVSFIMLTWNRKAFVEKSFQAFYAKKAKDLKYGFLNRDVEKYNKVGMSHMAKGYQNKNNGDTL